MTIGTAVRACFQFFIGILVSGLLIVLILLISQGIPAVILILLFICLYVISAFRFAKPEYFLFGLACSANVLSVVQFETVTPLIGWSILEWTIGIAITFFACILIFPRTAAKQLYNRINDVSEAMKEASKLVSEGLLSAHLDNSQENISKMNASLEKLRKVASSLSPLLLDAEREMMVVRYYQKDFKPLVELLQHASFLLSGIESTSRDYLDILQQHPNLHSIIIPDEIKGKSDLGTLVSGLTEQILEFSNMICEKTPSKNSSSRKPQNNSHNDEEDDQEMRDSPIKAHMATLAAKLTNFLQALDPNSDIPWDDIGKVALPLCQFELYADTLGDIVELIHHIHPRWHFQFPFLKYCRPHNHQDLEHSDLSAINPPHYSGPTKKKTLPDWLWEFGGLLTSQASKFGIKIALTAILFAMLRYFPTTRPYYLLWGMDSTLIIIVIIFAPSLGLQNRKLFHRTFGTILGVLLGMAIIVIQPCSMATVLIGTPIVAWPLFHLMCNPKHFDPAVITLFSFVKVCHVTYLVVHESGPCDVDSARHAMLIVAYSRGIVVLLAGVASLILSYTLWPQTASDIIQKIYDKVLHHFGEMYLMILPIYRHIPLTKHHAQASYTQEYLLQIPPLIQYSKIEIRQSYFSISAISKMQEEMQKILDSMIITRGIDDRGFGRFEYILNEVLANDRKQLMTTVLLTIHLLRSSFQTKAPLPYFLPVISESRVRLFKHLNVYEKGIRLQLWAEADSGTLEPDRGHSLYFFAYATSINQIYRSLEQIQLLGTEIYGTESFGLLNHYFSTP